MKLISPAFSYASSIPNKYTCEGEGINPPLVISEVPGVAKSLVLIVDDPDVPKSIQKEGVFVHWVLFNIDPKTTLISENSTLGTQGTNSQGKMSFAPFCPLTRTHRYFFKLYALDTKLSLSAGSTKEDVLEAMQGHILAQAQWMGMVDKEHTAYTEVTMENSVLYPDSFALCGFFLLPFLFFEWRKK